MFTAGSGALVVAEDIAGAPDTVYTTDHADIYSDYGSAYDVYVFEPSDAAAAATEPAAPASVLDDLPAERFVPAGPQDEWFVA